MRRGCWFAALAVWLSVSSAAADDLALPDVALFELSGPNGQDLLVLAGPTSDAPKRPRSPTPPPTPRPGTPRPAPPSPPPPEPMETFPETASEPLPDVGAPFLMRGFPGEPPPRPGTVVSCVGDRSWCLLDVLGGDPDDPEEADKVGISEKTRILAFIVAV